VRFRKSIRVTIEHGHANKRMDDVSSTAYWYQVEPHEPFGLLPVERRLPRPDGEGSEGVEGPFARHAWMTEADIEPASAPEA
jgi:hypothetical protein